MVKPLAYFLGAAAVGLGVSALAGCASTPTVQDLAARCDAYGFQRGTLEFAQCAQAEVLAYTAGQQAHSARIQAAGAALMQQGQAMNARPVQQPLLVPYTPIVTCRQNAWGVRCQ